ncbi:ECF RNA polymerase sigma factor SigE [Planctomycetes bacterium Poly30]|uniref:ECF RNA polymerase sigma factor SigE n=1 Tax=Saltatorellus ferox TaxID=2528018 RepID=A0A518EY80_9BACT|nr:ECF RNA polymerase sigma factor SigE [Planctomycetes bacterium Poly30]
MTAVHTIDELFDRFLELHNEEDLGVVFDLAAPELAAMARRARLDAAGCEDALQETFLTILRRSDSFIAGQRFMPWAQGIMARQIKVERRRQSRRLEALGLDTSDVNPDLSPGPRQVLEDSELRRQVEDAIAGLSMAQRDVVERTLLKGESPSDLALEMGLSANTVAVRLHRGLSRIRKVLPKAAVLGVAGLLTSRVRGEASVRSSIQGASRRGGFEIVSTQAWWLTPGAAMTAAGLGAVLTSAWLLQGDADSKGPHHVDASVLIPARRIVSATGAVTMPREPDRFDRTLSSSPTPEASGGDEGAAARKAGVLLHVLAPDGRPVGKGTEVFALPTEPQLLLPTEPMVALAVTDENGELHLPNESEIGDRTPLLYARAPIGAPACAGVLEVDLSTPPTEGWTLQLTEALTLEFEVKDEAGQAVAGAEVAALGLIDELFSEEAQRTLEEGMLWPIGYRHLFGGVTDSLGRCTVRGFLTQGYNGQYVGSAASWKDGHAAYAELFEFAPDDPKRLRFILPRLSSVQLAGEVVDERGLPIADTSVSFNFRGLGGFDDSAACTTGSDGRWSIDSAMLEWFPIELRFEREGYVTSELALRSPGELDGEPPWIVLSPAATLSGHLIGSDGQPTAGELELIVLGKESRAMADENGQFTFTGLRTGASVLTAIGSGPTHEMSFQDVESFDQPIRVTLRATDLAPDVNVRLVDPESGDPMPISRLTLLRHGETSGAWPFVRIEGGSGLAEDVPPGSWSVIAEVDGDGRVFGQEILVPASEEPQLAEIQAAPGGSLEVTVHGAVGLDLSSRKVMIARALGPEIPFWVRSSNELATHELSVDYFGKDDERAVWAMPGPTDVTMSGPGWVTRPTRCEIRPGETMRLDLEAVPSGRVILRHPALDSPGCVTFEVCSETSEWMRVSTAMYSAEAVGEHEVQLPPGHWKWRATCSAILDEARANRAIPQETGEIQVVEGETVEISLGSH